MKKTSGSLSISANVECPYCEAYIDLFELDQLTDEGYIYSELLGQTYGAEDWNEEIECPTCQNKFIVEYIEW